MDKQEFLRPFSDEEFEKAYVETGFDDIGKEYAKQEIKRWREHCLEEYIGEDIDLPVPDLLAKLQSESSMETNCLRDATWRLILENSNIPVYIDQRKKGQSHEWSAAFANEYYMGSDNIRYVDTMFREMEYQIKDEEFLKELKLYLQHVSDDPIFIERYSYLYQESADDIFEKAREFAYSYHNCINKGKSETYARAYADASEHLAPEYCEIYAEIYEKALIAGATEDEAYNLADTIADNYVNSYMSLELSKFKRLHKEIWERELYYEYFVKEKEKSGEPLSTLLKNEIRKELEINPIDEPLSYEDEKYLELKTKFINNGIPEWEADRKAYKMAYAYDDKDINNTPFHSSTKRDFNHEILQTMFPNDDIDADDFEYGVDMEDFNED